MSVQSTIWHRGGCHCGAVRIEVRAPAEITVLECNCSMCAKVGFLHLIVPKEDFRLVQGEEALTLYSFGTGTAKHLFCKHCGVKAFYVPRSHPDGYSVNLRCLDQSGFDHITIEPFDGRNWENNAGGLAPLPE
ncbi:MAG: GFA family protein [Alphaproteobacteria bacterium]